MPKPPEVARVSPKGERLLDLAVQLGPLLAEGNVPSPSLSQIDWLLKVLDGDGWGEPEMVRDDLVPTLRTLRAELTTRKDGIDGN